MSVWRSVGTFKNVEMRLNWTRRHLTKCVCEYFDYNRTCIWIESDTRNQYRTKLLHIPLHLIIQIAWYNSSAIRSIIAVVEQMPHNFQTIPLCVFVRIKPLQLVDHFDTFHHRDFWNWECLLWNRNQKWCLLWDSLSDAYEMFTLLEIPIICSNSNHFSNFVGITITIYIHLGDETQATEAPWKLMEIFQPNDSITLICICTTIIDAISIIDIAILVNSMLIHLILFLWASLLSLLPNKI